MKPTIGRIVIYRLRAHDAEAIMIRRNRSPLDLRGNAVAEGDEFPMMIVRVWGDQPDSCVNGKVQLDGSDTHWATSIQVGEGPGTFSWPAPVFVPRMPDLIG